MGVGIILSLLLLLTAFIYKILIRNHSYFQKRGIEFNKPVMLFFGNMWDALIEQEDYEAVVEEFYRKFRNEK